MDAKRRQEAEEQLELLLARLRAEDPSTADWNDALRSVEELRTLIPQNGNGHAGNGHDGDGTSEAADLLDETGEGVDPHIVLEPAGEGEDFDASPLLERLTRKRDSQLHYQALEELGRGGMGSVLKVWDSELRRPIAMKVAIARDGDGSTQPQELAQKLARFLEEAQITGQLNHPGIVPVHELGVDSDGQVYFTMRLVRGRNLREIFGLVKSGEEGWTSTRALGVLMKVCEAMAYAHSRGVIHRDLKPSNIMVGRFGEVYVMDWGVAKVLGRPDSRDLRMRAKADSVAMVQTERSVKEEIDPEEKLITMDGAVVGTASYMSPEQARGEIERMDQRSDVYSLGAILYQLLTGQIPYVAPDARGVSAHLVWIWALEGPPKPVHAINPAVPAELAAICEKAMARQPRKRYADPLEMAADISAYIDGRVVRAYRTGAVVELSKWVSRNKPMAASLVAAIALLLGGLIATAVLFSRAERSARIAEEVAGFLNEDLLGAVAPRSEPGRGENLSLEALLDEASKQLEGRFDDMPEAESPIRMRLGRSYLSLGRYHLAEPHLTRSVELHEELYGSRDERTLEALGALADLRHSQGDLRGAEELYSSCLDVWRSIAGESSPQALTVLNDLAGVYRSQGRLDEAEEIQTECYEARRSLLGEENTDTLAAASDLADVYLDQGRYEEAEDLHSYCLAGRERVLGPDDPDTLASIASLADVYAFRGRYEDAEKLYVDCLAKRRRVSGEEHPDTLVSRSSLAFMHLLSGRLDLAADVERECLETRRQVLGENHPDTLTSLNNLAQISAAQGRYDQAERLATECLALRREVLGDQHPDTLDSLESLGSVYWVQGRYEEAEQELSSSLNTRRALLGKKHPDTLTSLDVFGTLRRSQGRLEEAEDAQSECLDIRRVTLGEVHPATLHSLSNLGVTYLALGRLDDAQLLLERCLRGRRRVLGPEHPDTLTSMAELAQLRRVQGRLEDAEDLLDECLETRRMTLGDDHPAVLGSLDSLAVVYLNQGRLEEAEQLISASVLGRRTHLGARHPSTLVSISNLARVLAAQGRFSEAEARLDECIRTSRRVFDERHSATLDREEQLANVYLQQGRYDEAEQLQGHCVQMRREVNGEAHPRTLSAINELANILATQRRYSEAEELLLGCLDFQRADESQGKLGTLQTLSNLADVYAQSGRHPEAIELLEECVDARTKQLGALHNTTVELVFRLGEAYRQGARVDDAIPLLSEKLDQLTDMLGTDPDGVDPSGLLLLHMSLSRCFRAKADYELAISHAQRAYELAFENFGEAHAATVARLDSIAGTYLEALDSLRAPSDPTVRARYLEELADVRIEQGRFASATEAIRESLDVAPADLGTAEEALYRRLRKLAVSLAGQGLGDDAEPLWFEAIDGLRRVLGEQSNETCQALEDLAGFYVDRGRLDDALAIAEQLLEVTPEEHEARARRVGLRDSIRAARLK